MKQLPELTNLRPKYKQIPEKQNELLANLGRPHIDSFNYMLREGIEDLLYRLEPLMFEMANQNRIKLSVSDITIAKPSVPISLVEGQERRIFPSECRQKGDLYGGMCTITLNWELDGIKQPSVTREMGRIPIMLRSDACNLSGLSPAELVERGEHADEWGGHFLIGGNEKLVRMLITVRRNYPVAMNRKSWKNRGKDFSTTGVLIRCVREDQLATNNVLHYIQNGTAKLMISIRKSLNFIPIMLLLKSLTNYTDNTIYRKLIAGYEDDQYYKRCIMGMLRDLHAENLHNGQQCRQFLGSLFRIRLGLGFMPKWYSDEQAGDYLLDTCLLFHLHNNQDKFNMLVLMMQKLYVVVQGKAHAESIDSAMMQEVLLGGHIYHLLLRELCISTLSNVRQNLLKLCPDQDSLTVTSHEVMQALKNSSGFQAAMTNFFATGNLARAREMGMTQESGLVIIAENINRMRYMSHFRAVHRGSFFLTMRTTEARQLTPDAWGFICPVHTPDGTPCGLLNHLTSDCTISVTQAPDKVKNIEKHLVLLGMHPIEFVGESALGAALPMREFYSVLLEGKVLGMLPRDNASQVVQKLRMLKIDGVIPTTTEIVFVPARVGGQFPGLFLFVGPARMMRPVKNLTYNRTELIGTFEQVYLDICITPEEAYPNLTTHMELSKTSFLSNLAQLIPMPDCNQSPRNMYQCQMGKQTMGTPCQNWNKQCTAKMYRLQTPAAPLFRPVHYDNMDMDDYAMGTNAIVAVVSYTGYDMEDAMIINKSAEERGFAAGTIYKHEKVELGDDSFFARDPRDASLAISLDNDGMPFQGAELTFGTPFYCYFDVNDHQYHVVKYKSSENGIVDSVKMGSPYDTMRSGKLSYSEVKKQCIITYRIPRNPNVGDKFASRAGQKGICSQKWPAIDLPFTESGMIPDIIFNPHGFPSRMTIAMMIETMAGKTAACHGLVHDATPFRFNEENTAIDYFGRLLESSGYNYYGTERMYSGVDGREMKADIFFGVVHYQRLRHMVSDKWQVRSTGPIDQVTQQPNKGRKRGGGVRFGEMERDGLMSHGAAFLLQDRLFHGSDKVTALVCRRCGTLLGPLDSVTKRLASNSNEFQHLPATCRLCQDDKEIGHVEIPYIFKFLVSQLSSMNINVKLQCSFPDL
ncbi:AGAP009539-PA-like protein [Anopheles sinensis]|uniref:DNA-directed RNA polymerase subunit beta n=1 Tax=Anopheles sinensis TaxID=74873 RepID=A0A084VPA9_ANOSI|nr:AGAP009539-PA-like protein [Anopheles sinensis]